MMNYNNLNDHNWRGLAAAMNLTADDVRQMEEGENGKMTGLFDTMIHTKKTIKDLLDFLRNPAVQRLDVIDEIVEGCGLSKKLSESDNTELDETGWFVGNKSDIRVELYYFFFVILLGYTKEQISL